MSRPLNRSSKNLRRALWLPAAAAGLLLAILLAVSYGAKSIPLPEVWAAIFRFDADDEAHQIIRNLRLPRALGAAVTGMAFGAAGALMQGVTRNPLADTGILGVNAGAAFVVALAFAFLPSLSYFSLILLSFAGAALATLFIVMLGSATPGGLSSLKLTIAGAVAAALLHSFSTGVAIYYGLSQDLAFWYAGGVAGVRWSHLKLLAPIVIVTLAWSVSMGRSITFLSLGDESAVNLGVHAGRIRVLAMTAAVLLAGSSVSVAGAVGFVGLVAPHVARRLVSVDYRLVIPMSALLGGTLLELADIASRMVSPPREFAIGAMVALVGVPFFLYLARKEGRSL
ncbi:FecCD family ABC transporter permease [Paenibacillus physcomitrellae]|uniref:Ferrichrome ABC transporter permease n=1 Tax=Paenibacillus physcomitrellae TaxID=1619311 RepID=A0ABQ1FX59_9BACL|nr:iron ABC transporter permease [Paenibacillus physcomitrellae]GGA33130.1 ferrichrome ABC transporter permease [Paenibacillus physcomitrellae]